MLIIDRIEGDFAVCEDKNGTPRDIPLSLIDGSPQERTVLIEAGGRYRADPDETERRLAAARERLDRLKAKNQQ